MAESNGRDRNKDLMVVGIGASAGGIEALGKFFEHLPAGSGMAFIVILHLSPTYESRLAEVLQAKTRMRVTQVTETVRVEPDRVYVIPPDKALVMADGEIRLVEREPAAAHHHRQQHAAAPVDLFFRTLADSHRERAVAVVLSGAGVDGSLGVGRIKEAGGVAIAQDPQEAEHSGMPVSAIETGGVDFILRVSAIPEKLISLKENADQIRLPPFHEPRASPDEGALQELLTLLRARTKHDFSGYKRGTILRRIERRMQVTECGDIPAYLEYVREQPEELHGLLRDLLISVTNFFRDAEAFRQLETEVVPRIFPSSV